MDLTKNLDLESVHVRTGDTARFSVSGDIETLIHIIKMTGQEVTLYLIIDSLGDDETLADLMESSGDVDTLNGIIELMESTEASKLLNNRKTFSQDELNTALMFACRRGYTFLVNRIVHLGGDVHMRDRNGNTPLLICAEKGFANIARVLIGRKANLNVSNDCGDTALILAANPAGSGEMVFLLMAQAGINVNHQNKEGYTALMKAIEAKNVNAIKLLLDSQENTTEGLEGIINCRSETAQDIADKLGIGSTVKFLIKYSIKVYNPLLAAVLICDLASFDMLMVCNDFEPFGRKYIIQDSFRAIFAKHEVSGESFSESEEMIIERLLDNGAEVSDCPDSSNPVLVAVRVGSDNLLKMLLKSADCSRLSSWTNILATSAECGHSHIMEILFKHNQCLAAKCFTTPALISAMKNKHLGCIEMLTKHGASLDIKFAFESAVKNNDSVRLRYLVENFKVGINRLFSCYSMNNFMVSAAHNGHIDIMYILLDAGVNVNCVSGDKKTPLMEAKNAEVVNFLVQRGALISMNIKEHGLCYSSLLHVLSYHSDSTDNLNIVKALLKHGAPVNEHSDHGSPLMIALLNRANKNIVQLLLDYGADVSVRDSRGNTVLMVAAKSNFTENIEYLLQHSDIRSMINEKNQVGSTALMISACKGNHAAVKALIDHGVDVNIKDVNGNTSLMLTVSSLIHNPEILTTLIQAGSDINAQNDRGYSPLMLAAETSRKEALIFLVNSGADVNKANERNETALSVAMRKFNPRMSCVNYLLNHGAQASYVKPQCLILMILENKFEFILKLIQHGLGPTEIRSLHILPANITTVSPFCMALMTGHVKLASYFVENLFVTKSDMFTLIHNKNLRQYLRSLELHECLSFLDKQAAQPLSLFSLAFITVQSAVSAAPGREERVSMLPLPQKFKDRLVFKAESMTLDVACSSKEMAASNSVVLDLEISGGLTVFDFDYDYDCDCFSESGLSGDEDEDCYVHSYYDYLH